MGSRFGALAEEEYDKIAPVIACTLPALTDSVHERKRGELAGEVTSELQVVGKAASIAIQTWVRNSDKTKARAEEREKNIGWIKRLFTAWRVSHAERTERRAEREEAEEDEPEEDETPVVAPSRHRRRWGLVHAAPSSHRRRCLFRFAQCLDDAVEDSARITFDRAGGLAHAAGVVRNSCHGCGRGRGHAQWI